MTDHAALRVGGLTVPFADAANWASTYLDAEKNRSSEKPYAYPAYDGYNAEHDFPDRITDADLLAPALLNVTPSIRGFYALQGVREALEKALPPANTPGLQDASEQQVVNLVEPIYAVLDDPGIFDVRSTTLSKIFHRKRPHFLVLHDTWVWTCYQEVPGAPVPPVKGRSRAAYMAAISLAIRHDLRSQLRTWLALHEEASRTPEPAITLVRLLDIIAWKGGQEPQRFLSPAD